MRLHCLSVIFHILCNRLCIVRQTLQMENVRLKRGMLYNITKLFNERARLKKITLYFKKLQKYYREFPYTLHPASPRFIPYITTVQLSKQGTNYKLYLDFTNGFTNILFLYCDMKIRWRMTLSYLTECPSCWVCLVQPHDETEVIRFSQETTELMCPSHCVTSGVHDVKMSYHWY